MIKVSDFVMKFLAEAGVKDVFMLSGGGCMHLVDSLGKNPDLNYVPNLHEQASAIAADAYSQYTNNIGAALVTTGPGGTNAITGITASFIDSIPVIVISGQVKKADLMAGKAVRQMGPQEVDIISLVKPVTKYAETVMEPESIRYHLQKALYLAKSGRPGPVWVSIPLDVQGALIDEASCKEFVAPQGNGAVDISGEIQDVISCINKAERPVILAGNGIRLGGAQDSFIKLIDALNIPVLTTWKAIDLIPEGHRLYCGRPGSIGQRGANFIQQNADLIITIGARLDFGQVAFSYANFAREAKKVIVDIDAAEIKKIDARIDVPVVADAKVFIDGLLTAQGQVNRPATDEWRSRCVAWKERYPVILPEYRETKGAVNTYTLIDELSNVLSADDVLVPGSSGSCSEITLQAFRVKQGQRVLNSPGLGSMGFGLAASIGACFASGKKRTICIIGDGGLQHNIQELELLKRYQLPIKLFVLSNNGYGSIRNMQQNHFEGRLVGCDPSSGVTVPDIIKVAGAYGLRSVKIENQAQLKDRIKAVLDGNDPVLCDVIIDANTITAPRVSSLVKADGTIVSKPMEDLWPFLDREEFKKNMIIHPLED